MSPSERPCAGAFAAGTVVTGDYLPWARVLAASFREHHPEARFVVVVLDGPEHALPWPGDAFELLGPADIGLSGPEFGWMATIYDGFELSCAVKPWLLRTLLTEADAAIYFDADILVCGALDGIAGRAAETGLVLTPHSLELLPDDGLLPDDNTFLCAGQFNAGFVAAGRDGVPFLDWWATRLERECLRTDGGDAKRFVDQRWLDLAINYAPLHVLRDRGANVAYWNLGTRRLHRDAGDGALRVDSEPLRFLHFSGFDPEAPRQLSKYLGEPARVRPAPGSVLAELCDRYARQLRDAGLRPAAGAPYAFNELPGGIPLDPPVRRALRAALLAGEEAGDLRACDPLDPATADVLVAWLTAPTAPGAPSRYLAGLHASHAAVRATFPNVPGADGERFATWARTQGVALGLVPAPLAETVVPLALEGARSFVVLARAAEVLGDPALLRGIAQRFCATDDLTLAIWAPGRAPEALATDLEPVLAAAGLDGPNGIDMMGLVDDVPAASVAGSVHAVLSRAAVEPALAGLPRVEDGEALWALAGGLRTAA
jgi:hypothetical protein